MSKKVIYVAGPYTNDKAYRVYENILESRKMSLLIWEMGHVALSPHMNAAHMEGIASDEDFIEGTKELMRRCDAVIVLTGWQDSKGTLGEIKEATKIGMPIFYSFPDLQIWLEKVTVREEGKEGETKDVRHSEIREDGS